MNPFVSKISRVSWEIPVSILCIPLGVMIYMATIKPSTRSTRDLPSTVSGRLDSVDDNILQKNTQLSSQVNVLQQQVTKLQNAMADESKQGKVLNQDLQDTKEFAGLTDAEGPGITVTLRDSTKPLPPDTAVTDKIIHDVDVLRVVNELWASGAEAIAINGHRLSIGSSIRCVGPTVLIDDAKVASPIVVRAIGDASTLEGALETPGGLYEEFQNLDPAMIEVDKVKKQVLPAYTGPTQHILMTVPKETK